MNERTKLEQAIGHIESQRAALGDTAADLAIAGLKQKLSAVEKPEESGERKQVTIMFADISGFTALSEKMDPEAMRDLMNRCFDWLVPCIKRYDGTIDKFIGDEIMALFGAPMAHENDPERALRAALEMQSGLAKFNSENKTQMGIHFGINTGLVLAGGIGSSGQLEYSVMGDVVNLAARLEDISERGQILVGADTYRLTSSLFDFEMLSPVSVKGKSGPVAVYRLVGAKAGASSARGLEHKGLSSPLVGREEEFKTVQELIEAAGKGRGGVVEIIGEAGLGKSRLMAELHYSAQNVQWLEGRTLSFGQSISYYPFQEIVRTYAGINEEDAELTAWRKLESRILALFQDTALEILPYLATLLAVEVQGGYVERVKYLDSDALGKHVFLAMWRFVERLARTQPLVLVFEDLQWMDTSSSELLEHILTLVHEAPLLLIGISRPDQDSAGERLRKICIEKYADCYAEIRLVPLSQNESAQLVNNLLTIEDLPVRVRNAMVQKADGNPFFIEEIIRSLLDQGAIVRDLVTGRWRVAAQIETMHIPDTVQGVIMARIDRLDEEMKQALRMAAVIGRSFLYRILREVDAADSALDEHLSRLQQVELIREKQVTPELEYVFKHALAQEATYESILLQKRRELHGQVAKALETLFSERLDEFYSLLAYHYARAENWARAQEYLFKSGDQAGHMAADAEALMHYQQAMAAYTKAFGDQWDPLQRAQMERKIGEAFFRRGEHLQALEHMGLALSYLGSPLPSSSWSASLTTLGEIAKHIRYRVLPHSIHLQPDKQPSEEAEEEARIYESMVWIASFNPEQVLLIMLRALNFSERNDFLPGIMIGFAMLQVIGDFMGLHGLADYYGQKAVIVAGQSQHLGAQSLVNAMRALHENIRGRWDASIEYAQRAMEAQRQSGHWNVRANTFAIMSLADAHIHMGKFAQALAYGQDLTRFGKDFADQEALCWGLSRQGFGQRGLGQLEQSISNLVEAMNLAESVPDYQTYVDAGGELGQCYLRQNELELAFTVFEKCQRCSVEHKLEKSPVTTRFLNGLAEATLFAVEQSDQAERADWLHKAERACQNALKQGKAYPPGMPEAMMLHGRYEWLRNRQQVAKKIWQRSLALAEKLGVHYDLGRIYLEIGTRVSDRDSLYKAQSIFAENGAEWDLKRAQLALEKL